MIHTTHCFGIVKHNSVRCIANNIPYIHPSFKSALVTATSPKYLPEKERGREGRKDPFPLSEIPLFSHTVLLVTSPHVFVQVSLPRMVPCVRVRDASQKRARVFCQRVKMKSEDDDSNDL
jgi:hypothetical protein